MKRLTSTAAHSSLFSLGFLHHNIHNTSLQDVNQPGQHTPRAGLCRPSGACKKRPSGGAQPEVGDKNDHDSGHGNKEFEDPSSARRVPKSAKRSKAAQSPTQRGVDETPRLTLFKFHKLQQLGSGFINFFWNDGDTSVMFDCHEALIAVGQAELWRCRDQLGNMMYR